MPERFAADARAQGPARLAFGAKPDTATRRLHEQAGFTLAHDAGGGPHDMRAARAPSR
ncbi:hypothetical protein Bsp3421_003111 [Burkholderia sp. FERM BP-3421]|jgi:hypothetical protein|uniref:hypothetical protein n=1 Tax=Burkholderia sp. FERM BP-3421 TaxID=1494466 RepID=UPI00235E327B|nr:hypothetical protein [Burkholderia sp. FERM BP-3421]WDD93064.1 hypothetical protein Bsp3421_003111 [Burkholderia sp. FERM BP-3421]